MDGDLKKYYKVKKEDIEREKRIISRLNLDKLPFKISPEKFCFFYFDLVKDLRVIFEGESEMPGLKWCLSTIKKFKVFLIIFEANELGEEIYKEKISNKLPEYSYKTIAQIVDEGLEKQYFIKLSPRKAKSSDQKIRNIRPAESITVEFINWKINILAYFMRTIKKHK